MKTDRRTPVNPHAIKKLSLLLTLSLISIGSPAYTQSLPPADPAERHVVYETDGGVIVAVDAQGTWAFDSWAEYVDSEFFDRHEKRCAPVSPTPPDSWAITTDCNSSMTNPAPQYDPSGPLYRIPVVVHVLMHPNGSGAISDALIHSQIDILNEDFRAISGTPGMGGADTNLEFYLATTDPSGDPSTGITRHTKTQWYNDSGNYANAVGWDTNRYLNIYTNTAGGNLGYAYVPSGGGVVGSSYDGIRVLWSAFGRNAPIGPPYDQGRTTTHEVGHYLGLYHTFQGGCASASGCSSNGDLICDTNPESSPNYSSCSRVTCGSQDPVKNYMDYSEDACMNQFSPDQANRMRCTLESFRYELIDTTGGSAPGQVSSPAPADGAAGVSAATSLEWSAASGADSYDVFLNTSSNLGGAYVGSTQGTSFEPGSLTAGATYYWRVDAVNSDGVTAGPVWSFSVDDPGGGGSGALFSDGFESGNYSSGGWSTANNDARVSGSAALSGSYGAMLRKTTSIEVGVSTVGATGIHVKYSVRTSGYDNGEAMSVEWFDGSSWNLLEANSSSSWVNRDHALPAAAANNPNFRLRISTNANRKQEKGYLDDVEVSSS